MKVFAKDSFREFRIKKGYTIRELSKKIRVTEQFVGQLERRITGISPAKAHSVLKVLGVEFDDIFELVERGEN